MFPSPGRFEATLTFEKSEIASLLRAIRSGDAKQAEFILQCAANASGDLNREVFEQAKFCREARALAVAA